MKRLLVVLIALAFRGIALGQSIAIPKSQADSHVVAGGAATINILANGERWIILNAHNGLGIQLQAGMPVGPTGQFQTNVVVNNDGGGSAQLSIVGDCQAETFTILGAQAYQGAYRTGLEVGPSQGPVAYLAHVEPDTDMGWVFAAVCGH